jgi:hypothetical protein
VPIFFIFGLGLKKNHARPHLFESKAWREWRGPTAAGRQRWVPAPAVGLDFLKELLGTITAGLKVQTDSDAAHHCRFIQPALMTFITAGS